MWHLRLRIKKPRWGPRIMTPGGQSRFCCPAKCPESGRRPVDRWLSGRLGIRTPDTWRPPSARARDILLSAKLVVYCFRSVPCDDRPAGRLPTPVCRTSWGSRSRAKPVGAWERTGRNRACIYAGRARPMGGGKVCAAAGAIGTGGPVEGHAFAVAPRQLCGGFPRKGRRGGAPRLSPCGGRRSPIGWCTVELSRARPLDQACPGGEGLFPRVA
jgi:hypothetical protein